MGNETGRSEGIFAKMRREGKITNINEEKERVLKKDEKKKIEINSRVNWVKNQLMICQKKINEHGVHSTDDR